MDEKKSWVEKFDQVRGDLVIATGGTLADLIIYLGALLPWILVTSLLQTIILVDFVEDVGARWIVSGVVALAVEVYAIALMIIDYKVQAFNKSLQSGEARIQFDAGIAKLVYILAIVMIVGLGHVAPMLLETSRNIAVLSLFPLIAIVWYCYVIGTTGFTVRDANRKRAKREEDERLAKSTELMAEGRKQVNELDRMKLELELVREQRLAEEARSRGEEAKASAAEQGRLKKEAELRAKANPVVIAPPPIVPQKNGGTNGHSVGKPWDERSFTEIEAALAAGEQPPPIQHLATWQRYLKLMDEIEVGQQFGSQAAELVGVNGVRFLKDLHLLASHRLVKEVSKGVYVLLQPIGEK